MGFSAEMVESLRPLGEIVDSTNEARGFSFLAVCFSLGLLVGPLLGGQFADPAARMPGIFEGTIFERHRFLMPNLVYACFAGVALLLGICFLEESLPASDRKSCGRRQAAECNLLDTIAEDSPKTRSTSNKITVCFLISYSLLSGYYSAWQQDFVTIVSLPSRVSGFGFSPAQIGMIQNFAGVGLLFTQLLFYPRLTRRFGLLACFVGGCSVNMTVTALFPAYGLMADADTFGKWRYVPLAAMMMLGQAAAGFCFPTMFVWINRSLEGKDRGTWNGWANSLGALSRGLFPPAAGAFLSLGLKSGVGVGRYLPVFVNVLIGASCVALTTLTVRAETSSKRKLDESIVSATSLQPYVPDNEPTDP